MGSGAPLTIANCRVFISYGRRDASALAGRLKGALEHQGASVWLDSSSLRGGRAWEEQIVNGLAGTDVVIALLSPHSTRRFGAGTDDSVCLDELALARYGQPSKPIIPIMAVAGASIPLTILRLHYLDFLDALASDDNFDRRFAELLTSMAEVLAGRTTYRSWESWLRPAAEFDRFLFSKRRGFIGREWLFRAIDVWRRTSAEPAFIVRGDPGIGKSALIAELAYGALSSAALVTYCCQWDVIETLRPAAFVRTCAWQIASRLPEYAAMIEAPEIRRVLEYADSDPGSAFETGVLSPLGRLGAPAEGPALLCVDALDEAGTLHEGLTIVELLARALDRLPSWLKLLVTTREDKTVSKQLGGQRIVVMDAGGGPNMADLKEYVAAQFDTPELSMAIRGANSHRESLLESLVACSAGNFLYAQHFLDGVRRGATRVDDLEHLPPGLDGAYERYLRRGFPDDAAVARIMPVLEVLCAALGPIPRPLLGDAIGIDEREVVRVLSPLTSFLRQVESAGGNVELTFWHKSLYDFLVALENADGPFGVDASKGHGRLASLFIDDVLKRGRTDPSSLPPYLHRNGLDHLGLSGHFFDGLSAKQINDLVYCAAFPGSTYTTPAVGHLSRFAPGFIARAIASNRVDVLERLIDGLNEAVRRHYEAAGLMQIERYPNGIQETFITGEATQPVPLSRALLATSFGIFVVDSFFAAGGANPAFLTLLGKLDFPRRMADAIEPDPARKLSGYFSDQAYALGLMIENLSNRRRADTWSSRSAASS